MDAGDERSRRDDQSRPRRASQDAIEEAQGC